MTELDDDADLVAALLAIDPIGTGGVVVRCWPGPERDRWLARFRSLIAADRPRNRIPLHIAEDRLLGGLDLTATLQSGRPVLGRGVLAASDGGFIILPQAERIALSTVAQIAATIDQGAVVLERDGIAERAPSRFGVIAFDEGLEDERPAMSLIDRLAFSIDISLSALGEREGPASREGEVGCREPPTSPRPSAPHRAEREQVTAARALLPDVVAPEPVLDAICRTAMALGVDSARGTLLTLAAARALAALEGRLTISKDDAAAAVRLVLAPRATLIPMTEPPEAAPSDDTSPPHAAAENPPPQDENDGEPTELEMPLDEMVLAAAAAAIPPDVLERLRSDLAKPGSAQRGGKAGALQASQRRGRPAGVRRGMPGHGARLNVIETLRAAAPWQRLRTNASPGRISLRRDDFRIQKLIQRAETTTIFLVDASGSLAINRLAEAKGAVELLLAECYIRRDRVALIAFRGKQAELLLPPTRSLVRAKRSLASLPGGGGTPLAAALDAAVELAATVRRGGQTPVIVLMTDGRANVARDGAAGRPQAEADALLAARALRAARLTAVLVDTSAKIQPIATEIATAMGAAYLQLPHADASLVARSVRAAAEAVPCRS